MEEGPLFESLWLTLLTWLQRGHDSNQRLGLLWCHVFVIRCVSTGEGPGEYWDQGPLLSMELWGKPIPAIFKAPQQQRCVCPRSNNEVQTILSCSPDGILAISETRSQVYLPGGLWWELTLESLKANKRSSWRFLRRRHTPTSLAK